MSKIMNLITYDKLLKNITAIHINLICSDTFKIPLWSGWKNPTYLWYASPRMILNARYTCSNKMTRIIWCGKVILLNDNAKSLRRNTSSCSPCEPPMTKVKSLAPCVIRWSSVCAKSSELNILPAISNVMTVLCGLILLKIRCPSFSFTCSISFTLIVSGAFSSGTSTTSILEYAPSRLVYSAMASFQYFSFNFPTAKIVIFILTSYVYQPKVIHMLFSYPHIYLYYTVFAYRFHTEI